MGSIFDKGMYCKQQKNPLIIIIKDCFIHYDPTRTGEHTQYEKRETKAPGLCRCQRCGGRCADRRTPRVRPTAGHADGDSFE